MQLFSMCDGANAPKQIFCYSRKMKTAVNAVDNNVLSEKLIIAAFSHRLCRIFRETKRPSLIQQELQKQQIEAMMSTQPTVSVEAKSEGEDEPGNATKFQLANVRQKVVVSVLSRSHGNEITFYLYTIVCG